MKNDAMEYLEHFRAPLANHHEGLMSHEPFYNRQIFSTIKQNSDFNFRQSRKIGFSLRKNDAMEYLEHFRAPWANLHEGLMSHEAFFTLLHYILSRIKQNSNSTLARIEKLDYY